MKVALVYHYFARYREPVLRELFKRLSSDLIMVSSDGRDSGSIVALSPDRCGGEWQNQWRVVKNCWLLKNRLLWQSGILSATRDVQVVIALGSVNFVSTWVLLLFCKLRRQRVLLWTHGLYGNESRVKLMARRWFYGLSDGLLLYGHYARKLLIEQGFKAERLHVIYNSLDLKQQESVFHSRDVVEIQHARVEMFSNTCPVLAFVGRLTLEKKLEMLLHAAAKLQEQACRVNCLFIGDGSERARLCELATKLKVDVHFAGEIYDEKCVGRFLMMADLVISPGNVGLTAIHALAYGVPVITHSDYHEQMPEFEAIQDGVSGTFFRHGDAVDLANKIKNWLLSHPMRTQAIAIACREIIKTRYNPDIQADTIIKAISYNNLE